MILPFKVAPKHTAEVRLSVPRVRSEGFLHMSSSRLQIKIILILFSLDPFYFFIPQADLAGSPAQGWVDGHAGSTHPVSLVMCPGESCQSYAIGCDINCRISTDGILADFTPSLCFIMKGCWILQHAFSFSIETMMWFFYFIIFMWSIIVIDSNVWTRLCNAGINSTLVKVSRCIILSIFCYIWFACIYFFQECFHPHSQGLSACSFFIFICLWHRQNNAV